MASSSCVPEPSRSTEMARLELAQLPPETPLEQVFACACELSAEALVVERVGVWLFDEDRTNLRCHNLFERSRGEHSSGAVLRVADFPTYFASLKVRKAVPAEIAATEPWTSELTDTYLRPLGIRSMLDAGIFVGSELVGVVCHEHVGPPREWTTEARDFAGSVADLVALRIQLAQFRARDRTAMTECARVANQHECQALKRMGAGVAHDFKNLLAVFLTHGDLLRRHADPDIRQQGLDIVAAAGRGINLADELLEFARPRQRTPSVVKPADFIAEVLPMLRATVGARHEVRYTPAPQLGQVLIDKSQLTRLLLNLVVNAGEAMIGLGGPIDIRLSLVERTGPGGTDHFILLEVADRGCGMDATTLQRAFEPFFTTKARGNGLGLAIVRQIIERAGGHIDVDSAPGRGTTFRIYLPRIGAAGA